MISDKLNECKALIADMAGENEYYFDTPIKAKKTPHHEVFTIHGACNKGGFVYLMDGAGEWHGPLAVNQENAEYVISSLLQRLKLIKYETSTQH